MTLLAQPQSDVPRAWPANAKHRLAPRGNRAKRTAPWLLGFIFTLSFSAQSEPVVLSNAEVDAYNVHVGTQTFAGLYQFTSETLLVETTQAIADLGSDILKLYLGSDFPRQYRIPRSAGITNLLTLARDEPSARRVLAMPFRHVIAWAYPFANSDNAWANGYSATERTNDYRELYDLTRHLLTQYSGSGKTFYLGHWEGDGYLTPWTTNPSPVAIQGMIAWLNNRQQAIDDAKSATPHNQVDVYGYAEVNRVRDAMHNGPTNNQRVINQVIPYVTNLDYVSYSSYDAMNLGTAELYATLDYVRSQLPTNKNSRIPGSRLWIGEYGWGGTQLPSQQEPTTRAYIRRLLNYGPPTMPFILFWEIYNNEPNRHYCLIDSNQVKTPTYDLHQRFINRARLLTAQFKERQGRLPTDAEFVALASPLLDKPLVPPVSLVISNHEAQSLTSNSAQVAGTLTQGIYGDPCAMVRVLWGQQDGETIAAKWEHNQSVALNTNFNPTVFSLWLTNLAPDTDYFFRYYAHNQNTEAWAPDAQSFHTPPLALPVRLSLALSNQSPLLTWPTNAGRFTVYSTSNLTRPITWSLVTNRPEQTDTAWQLHLPVVPGLSHQFYRLQSP